MRNKTRPWAVVASMSCRRVEASRVSFEKYSLSEVAAGNGGSVEERGGAKASRRGAGEAGRGGSKALREGTGTRRFHFGRKNANKLHGPRGEDHKTEQQGIRYSFNAQVNDKQQGRPMGQAALENWRLPGSSCRSQQRAKLRRLPIRWTPGISVNKRSRT